MKCGCNFKNKVWFVVGVGLVFATNLAAAPQADEMLRFSLFDAFGREVRSQDYKGVPIFLEFGACW